MHSQSIPPQYIPAGVCQCGCGTRTHLRRDGRYSRFHTGHSPRKTTAHRELQYVIDSESGCWVWSAGVLAVGYGFLGINGKTTYAHRFSYEQAHGPVPTGWHVHHKCGNRRCVNPEHLEALPPREHFAHHAKITKAERDEIRGLAGTMSTKEIATRYGLTAEYVSRLLLYREMIPAPPRQYVADMVPAEMQRQIVEMAETMSQRGIAKRLGIPRSHVRRVLVHRGLAKP